MPSTAANPPLRAHASDGPETPASQLAAGPQSSPAPRPNHHLAETSPATLPPTLTPAVSLGVLSTLWGASQASPVPAVVTHAASRDGQEPPPDLAASTGSVPSTTPTLINTLPPNQSAALRALNAPAFQSQASPNTKTKSAKSTSSQTTLSSQPVVVRTYSGSRHNSRHPSGRNSPRYPSMNGHTSQNPSALSAGLRGRTERLPTLDEFSFSAVLRAVDPEIRDAIDAIAEICARSRMSLADEYDAHLPPQGEITDAGPVWASGVGALAGRGRLSRISQGWSAAENQLTAVPEASSSSERLAGDGRGSARGNGRQRSQSAYGSLKSVISGGSGRNNVAGDTSEQAEAGPSTRSRSVKPPAPAWSVDTSYPAITIRTSPQASKQLSLDTSSTIRDVPEDPSNTTAVRPQTAIPRQSHAHRRNASLFSLQAPPRPRPGTLSSLTSWLPWPRPTNLESRSQQEVTRAETRLREMLGHGQDSGANRSRTTISVV